MFLIDALLCSVKSTEIFSTGCEVYLAVLNGNSHSVNPCVMRQIWL